MLKDLVQVARAPALGIRFDGPAGFARTRRPLVAQGRLLHDRRSRLISQRLHRAFGFLMLGALEVGRTSLYVLGTIRGHGWFFIGYFQLQDVWSFESPLLAHLCPPNPRRRLDT